MYQMHQDRDQISSFTNAAIASVLVICAYWAGYSCGKDDGATLAEEAQAVTADALLVARECVGVIGELISKPVRLTYDSNLNLLTKPTEFNR